MNETGHTPHYPVLLKHEEGLFTLHIPDLSILIQDSDLQKAYDQLAVARDKTLADYAAAGEKLPRAREKKRKGIGGAGAVFLHSLIATTTALMVVGLFVVAPALYLTGAIVTKASNAITERMQGTTSYTDLVGVIASRLEAQEPERKKKLVDSVRIIARELQPVADALRPLIVDPECAQLSHGTSHN